MYVTQECGQRWYRRRSWQGKKFRILRDRYEDTFWGFAIGPIMFIKGKRPRR